MVATWAIQERERLLREARARLPRRAEASAHDNDKRIDVLLDVVYRAFIARLSGAAVHPRTVDDLRTEWGAASLVAAAQGIAAALRDAIARRRDDEAALARDRLAITEALDDLVALLDPDGAPLDIDVVETPRPTLVHAIDQLAARPPMSVEGAPRALLRMRATTTRCARGLEGARIAASSAPGVLPQASAADEMLLSSTAEGVDGVLRLIRAASSIASSLGAAAHELTSAIVLVNDDPLAALLRASALPTRPGLVFLDDDAWRLAGDRLAETPDAVHAVDPSAAFGNDRWELSALLVRPPFFGRDDELARIVAWLQGDAAGPSLTVLFGAPGVGKAALVRAALGEAGFNDERAAVLWGAADALLPTPYAAIAAMVRALAGAPTGHPRAAARLRRLVFGLAPALSDEDAAELRSLLPVLAMLLGVDDDEVATVDALPARALRVAIRRALLLVVAGLRARAGDGRPAVLVVAGADAIDGPTRDALSYVGTQLGSAVRVLMLATSRLRLPATLEEVFRVERIELRGLAPPVARELLGALLDRDPSDDDEQLGPLLERAKGSPLGLLHGARLAVEQGLISQSAGRWRLVELDEKRIPARIDRVLRLRVERLPPEARRLVAACALLGVTFSVAAAEFVGVRLGLGRDEVARALALLVDTGFLARSDARPAAPVFFDDDDGDSEAPLAFEHPLVRAAAEATIDERDLPALHAVVADALEAVVSTGVQALAPALARHHRLAGHAAAALEHLVVSVRRSARLDDRHGAMAMAREGIELAGDDAELTFPFHLEIEAVRDGGPRAAHKEALKQLMRVAEACDDPRKRATALLRVVRFNLMADDPDLAENAARRAADQMRFASAMMALGAADTQNLEAHALRMLALVLFRKRDLDGARLALGEARSRTRSDDKRALGALEHQEGLMLLERGDAVSAIEHLLKARMHRRAAADMMGECACLDGIADCYVRRGRLATALALLEHADRLRERIGDEMGRAQSKRSQAEVLLSVGDADVGYAAADEARALSKKHGLERLEHTAIVLSARALMLRGDAQGADSLLDGVRRRTRDPFARMEATVWGAKARLARALAATGPARERALRAAFARARDAATLGEEHGFLSGQVLGMATAGLALLHLGEPGQALAWSQRAAELFDDRTATALPVEDVLGAYAQVLAANGDEEEAANARARALSILEARSARLPPAALVRFWALPGRRELKGAAQKTSQKSAS